jgi:hypothetical protein
VAGATRLRTVTAATQALAETLVNLLVLHAYTFDPEYGPIRVDELDPR